MIPFLSVILVLNACNKNDTKVFYELNQLIEQQNFFKAKALLESDKNNLSVSHRLYVEAILNNAFNRLEDSEHTINSFIHKKEKSIPDSLLFKLQTIKYDNAVKLYRYKEAKNTIQAILNDYRTYLDSASITDYRNSLKIWEALENIPPQEVDIQQKTILKMTKDIAGLNTLKVSSNDTLFDFVFDTGANLSTTTQAIAKRLNMKIIPVDIEVESITSASTIAQLAVCEKLSMGSIDMYNVVFLVLPDNSLSFPQINYQIYGIIGFPAIEALKEIRITKDGNFIVPVKESVFEGSSNMAMSELTPLIYINDKHFTFDTGANGSMFYRKFYLENKDAIVQHYQPQKISFGGAAGKSEYNGYKIDHSFTIGKKEITVKDIQVLKEKVKDNEKVYGNIGQDLIQQFDTIILNFDWMFITFE